jgi:hypothetical protein
MSMKLPIQPLTLTLKNRGAPSQINWWRSVIQVGAATEIEMKDLQER